MERFLFFNAVETAPGVYDREYVESDFADYFGSVLSSGLLHVDKNPNLVLSVEPGTMNTVVTPGTALIKGHLYENTTPRTLTHSIPEPTMDRIDRIVLRLDLRNQSRHIRLFVKEGESSSSPVAPTLQRDQFIYELSLGQIRVRKNTVQLLASDIVDERLDEHLCGLVYSLISIPSDQLQNWINARIVELRIEADRGLTDYLQAVAIAEDALQTALQAHETNAQGLFDSYSGKLQAKLTQFESDFMTWFNGLKEQLDRNVALSLQNQINIMNDALSRSDNKLDGHLADYMYQIPSIVGSQIRINKLSDTNRLFFKMAADLSGDITISTDNGATSKPLIDVEGNPITQLEKGFVEVVADASFFILRNRGISGTDKQALIEIVNETERNESDLKTQFVNEVNAVDLDGGINLPASAAWADILAQVPNIKTGKKWASGSIRGNSNGMIVIASLGFKPSVVMGRYLDGGPYRNAFIGVRQEAYYMGLEGGINFSTNDTGAVILPGVYFADDGFTGVTRRDNPSALINWIAFE